MPQSFYDLKIWQDGAKLVESVYEITSKFPATERYGLFDQMRRASNSVIANIAESQGRFSYKDRIRILYQARGEIFEVRSHIRIARRLEFIHESDFHNLEEAYENLLKQVNSYIRHLASRMP